MSGQACPVCGTPLVIPPTGRRPVYCGAPCRQKAARARDAVSRAVGEADQAREQLADAMHRASILGSKLGALHGSIPLPGKPDSDGALLAGLTPWEEEFVRAARDLERAVHRAAGYAEAHQRAVGACRAARATGFRSAIASGPGGDETPAAVRTGAVAGAGFVGEHAAAAAATEPASPEPAVGALCDAAEDIIASANPSTATGSALPDEITDAVEALAGMLPLARHGSPAGMLALAARRLLGIARARTYPGDVQDRIDALAPAWDALASALAGTAEAVR